MSSAACCAVSRLDAATSATGSPWNRTTPSASTWIRARRAPTSLVWPGTSVHSVLLGTSPARTTAATPGSAAARPGSTLRIFADGYGERRTAPCSIPGISQSAAYAVRACTLSTASWRTMDLPTARSRGFGGRRTSLATCRARGDAGDGVDDLGVPRAAAKIPRDRPPDVFARRRGVLLQEREGGQQHAGYAESTLRGAVSGE